MSKNRILALLEEIIEARGGYSSLAEKLSNIEHIEVFNTKTDLPTIGNSERLYLVKDEMKLYVYQDNEYQYILGGSGVENQVTKLGVNAPTDVVLTIKETMDFKRPFTEVLKFSPSELDKVITVCAFDNSDSGDFESNELVSFNGTMHLKTSYSISMVNEGALGDKNLFSVTLDRSKFKSIDSLEVI